jgi:hypothetical protein
MRRAVAAARSIALLAPVEILVVLDAGNTQPRHARALDRALPAGELLEADVVAFADILEGEQSAIDGGDDLGLAAGMTVEDER